MKKLFIYYSLTGNGDFLAEKLKEKGSEIRKVTEKKKMPKSFFLLMMAGGFRAGINSKGKLVDFNDDIEGYDEILIGSPIWNGRLAPATNAVLARLDLKGKNVRFLIYSGSGEGEKAKQKLEKLFGNPDILFLKEPKKHPEELDKLSALDK